MRLELNLKKERNGWGEGETISLRAGREIMGNGSEREIKIVMFRMLRTRTWLDSFCSQVSPQVRQIASLSRGSSLFENDTCL